MKLLVKLEKNASFWFLIATSVVFFLLRLPSLFEPYWYGDEGIYEVIGYALTHRRLLYTGIWDNKPPMLYLIYAIFSGDQTGAKFLSLLAGLGATWALFALSKKLFGKTIPAMVTTGIFALLFGLPLIEGNIANAENFMLLPGVLAGLLVYKNIGHTEQKAKDKRRTTYLLAAGFLLGLSFLIKVVAVFDLSAFAVFYFLLNLPSYKFLDIGSAVKRVIPLIAGFFIPIVLCVGFFVATHTFSTFLRATLLSNVGYVNYGNQFIIPQGFLILKTLLVALCVGFFLLRRKKIAPSTLFIFLWVIFSIYSSLFSGRPYTHYALIMLPSITLLLGLFFAQKNLRVIISISIAAFLIFVTRSFTFYSHPISYYQNFLRYVTGQETTVAYQSFFDKVTPRDYGLAEYIARHRVDNQTLFVWGNSGQIYKLTNLLPPGRFIVAYHITLSPKNLLETQMTLMQNPPTYIIILPNQDVLPYSLANYREKAIIEGATIYEHVL